VLQGECFRSIGETFEGIGAAIVVQPPGDPVKVQPIQWVVSIPYVADSGKESQNPLDLLKPTPRAAVRPVRSPSSTRHASCTNPVIGNRRGARQQGNGESRQQGRPHIGAISTSPAPPRRCATSRFPSRRPKNTEKSPQAAGEPSSSRKGTSARPMLGDTRRRWFYAEPHTAGLGNGLRRWFRWQQHVCHGRRREPTPLIPNGNGVRRGCPK
jgi:hypothetical protein